MYVIFVYIVKEIVIKYGDERMIIIVDIVWFVGVVKSIVFCYFNGGFVSDVIKWKIEEIIKEINYSLNVFV